MNKDKCKVCNTELEAPNANYDEWHCCNCITNPHRRIKPKHTKGKWVVSPRWNYRKGISAKDTTQNEPDGYSVDAQRDAYRNDIAIASMQTYSDGKRPMDEVQANANLIAAAPELLIVAKEFLRYIDNNGGAEAYTQRDMIAEAIARAEGKTEEE